MWLSEIEYWQNGESASVMSSKRRFAIAEDPLQRARCMINMAGKAGTWTPRAAVVARAAVDLLADLRDAPPAVEAAALAVRIRADLSSSATGIRRAPDPRLLLEAVAPPPLVDDRVTFKLGQWLRYVEPCRARVSCWS